MNNTTQLTYHPIDGEIVPLPVGVLIFNLCVESLMFLPMLFGNILVLTAYFSFYTVRDENSNIFIVSLAITDLATGISIPFNIVKKYIAPLTDDFEAPFGNIPGLCYFVMFLQTWPSGASVSSLLMIAVDRAVAIIQPLRYYNIMTPKVCWIMTVVAHAFPIAMYIAATIHAILTHEYNPGETCLIEVVYNKQFSSIGLSMCLFVPGLLTFILHGYVVIVAIQQRRKIRNGDLQASDHRRKQHKILRTMSRIMGLYAVCFLPTAFMKTAFQARPTSAWWHQALNYLFLDIFFLNSALNPLVYSRSVPTFNAAFKKLLGRLKIFKSNIEVEPQS